MRRESKASAYGAAVTAHRRAGSSAWPATGGEIQFPVREGTIGGTAVVNVGNLYVLTDNSPYYWTVISQDGTSWAIRDVAGDLGPEDSPRTVRLPEVVAG